ncbi:SusC/RagA family TonB-linked outer membrane protein [Porphyromonas levii]|uniref:SusC/RagA family TonB-linked outer membrane protein n=1 Tax=Porphyromonas levii TaxID=28114 RepID=UPI001B8B899D|nr:SusC/RagA family TonB-linked outer membrane protein [Porphyromonas levii]
MKSKILLLISLFFLSIGTALGQTITVKGIVLDEKGEPVIGASVRLKSNPSVGAATGLDGDFTLKAKQGELIIVSYVGYKTQEVAAAPNLRIKLVPDTELLDEVMVVAFGTQKKAAFTGSAAVVETDQLSKHVTSNVANTLVGTVPGIQMRGGSGQPGSDLGGFNVRGVNAIGAGSSPLVILDGSPYPSALSNIPANDIESITILKDAASAALYGARGASGVILITTKKGAKAKPVINFDARIGANTRAIQEYDKITDPGEYYESVYAQFYNRAIARNLNPSEANLNANKNMNTVLKYNVFTVPDGEQLIGADGKLNPKATLGNKYTSGGRTYYLTPDNWTELAYKPALRQEYNLSISGGGDKNSYYLSIGYLNDNGVLQYSGYDRFSTRLKADYQFTDWGKVTANVGYVKSNMKSNPNLDDSWGATNIMYYTSIMAPIFPAYVREWKDGAPSIIKDRFGGELYDFGNTYPGIVRPIGTPGNPLSANRYNVVSEGLDQLNGSLSFDATITDYLKFNASSSLTTNLAQYSDYQNGLYGPAAASNGTLLKEKAYTLRTNHVQTLNFFKDFGSHYLNAMIGHEYYYMESNFVNAKKQGGFSPDILELNAFSKVVAGNSNTRKYNVEGFFTNLQYDYDNKYFASASYRRDASSRFDKDHMWGNFWSVGAAWLISQESFMDNATWVDLLKLKLSIGQQGNDEIRDYAFIDTYSLTQSSDTSVSPVFRTLGNPEITWETTTNSNIGVEFNLFKGRLAGNIDLYSKKTSDLLFWISIPESAGTRGYYGNLGDIRNSGVELSLSGTIIQNDLVTWTLFGNIAHNKSTILSLPKSKIEKNGGYLDQGIWYEEGGPMYNQMTRRYAGVNENGEALYYYDPALVKMGKDKNGNTVIEDSDTSRPAQSKEGTTTNWEKASRYAIGASTPDVFGGFGTTLKVGNFDASLQFDYQIGGLIYDNGYATLMKPMENPSSAGSNYHKDWRNAWSPTNKDSNIPRWNYGDKYSASGSDRFLTNASYLNFQTFTVGYTLPENLIPGVKKVRIYAAGENLAFWSKRKGLDPRFSFTENNSVGAYSPVRNISGGVQVTF